MVWDLKWPAICGPQNGTWVCIAATKLLVSMLQPYILIIPTYDSDLYTCTWVVPYLLGHPQAPLRGYENSHSKNPVVNHHCPAWQRKPIFRHTLKIICLVIANYIPIHIPVSCHIYSPFTFSVGESPVSTTHLLVLSCPLLLLLLLLLPIAYCYCYRYCYCYCHCHCHHHHHRHHHHHLFLSSIIQHPSSIIHRASYIMHHAASIIHHPSCIMHHASSIIHHPSSIIHHSSSSSSQITIIIIILILIPILLLIILILILILILIFIMTTTTIIIIIMIMTTIIIIPQYPQITVVFL